MVEMDFKQQKNSEFELLSDKIGLIFVRRAVGITCLVAASDKFLRVQRQF